MQGQTNKAILRNNLQRRLRRTMTDAEKKLWSKLRGKQLSNLKFRRQHPFEDYNLDFVCLENKIVIEVDGGQHQDRMQQDNARTQALEKAGFRILRYWNHDVLQQLDAVVADIWRETHSKSSPSSPYPLLEGEEKECR